MGLAESRGHIDIAVTEELNPWLWHLYVFMFCVSCLFPFSSSLRFSQVILEVLACFNCAKGNQSDSPELLGARCGGGNRKCRGPHGEKATVDQLPLPTAASSP